MFDVVLRRFPSAKARCAESQLFSLQLTSSSNFEAGILFVKTIINCGSRYQLPDAPPPPELPPPPLTQAEWQAEWHAE